MFHVVVEVNDKEEESAVPLLGTVVRSVEPYYMDQFQFSAEATSSVSVANEIPFETGNPVVQMTKGVFHLCKDADPQLVRMANGGDAHQASDLWNRSIPEVRSNLVCVLSVPQWMSPSELCKWMRQFDGAKHLRLILPPNPAFYMVAIEFVSQHHADHFYMSSNSQPYNSVENERCYAVFIREVTFTEPQNGILFDNGASKELPSCPICLEKLDAEESGLIWSLCNHQFHVNCLAQCEAESNCPVCRFSMHRELDPESRSVCVDCDSNENLWICLLCGNIGCSRYQNEHAELHFHTTGHTYALEIETQRVWDYTGDGYVHRLIQNNVDGKMVEIPDPNSSSMTRMGKEKDYSKLDAIVVEYNYLLTTQLESQRLYFEQRETEKEARIRALEEKLSSLTDVIPTHMEKQREERTVALLNAKISKLQSESSALQREITFLKDVRAPTPFPALFDTL